jgi:hypothetical protein
MNQKYRTELWSVKENGWLLLDYFSRKEHAIANAETYSLSRKTDARVIHKGQIVFVVEYKK